MERLCWKFAFRPRKKGISIWFCHTFYPNMLGFHRMALSISSFTVSSSLIPVFYPIKPLSASVIRKRILMKKNGFVNNLLCKNNWNGFSSSAIATDTVDSAGTAVSAEDEAGISSEEKMVLPTNESSESLLRIRHTVREIRIGIKILNLFHGICLSISQN